MNGLVQYAAANDVVLFEPRIKDTDNILNPLARCWKIDVE